jgi:uncharacterized protein
MPTIDTNLFVGTCPFRDIPSSVDDLRALREQAGIERAAATGFRSIFYYDPVDGLAKDLAEFEPLKDWLHFWSVVNPEFPQIEAQVASAADERRSVGIRLFPTLHQYALCSDRSQEVARMAADRGLPVNVTARLFDGRVAPRMVDQGEVARDDLTAFLGEVAGATIILSMFFFGDVQPLKVDWGKQTNVYLDLGCSKPSSVALDKLGEWFPLDRVMYGSAAPLYYWGGSRLALEGCRQTDETKEAILGGTAKEVLRWA